MSTKQGSGPDARAVPQRTNLKHSVDADGVIQARLDRGTVTLSRIELRGGGGVATGEVV